MKKIITRLLILFSSATMFVQAQDTSKSYTPEKVDFKHWYQAGTSSSPFQEPYETDHGQKIYPWATSNAGYSYLHKPDNPKSYPVYGHEGKMVLQTLEGKYNFLVKVPIVSGSAYVGEFSKKDLVFSPHRATLFGRPVSQEPIELKGKYAYSSGSRFLNHKNKTLKGKTDKGIIYLVLFEDRGSKFQLDGRSIFKHSSIVARAEHILSPTTSNALLSNDYKSFAVKVTPVPGKQIDFKNKKYKMTIVLSSSIDGGDYNGAIGSTLVVPELEVVYKYR